jgi:hypothetical protein
VPQVKEVFTGKPLDIISFLMGDNIDKQQLFDISPHVETKKRSLLANNYFHRLVGLLARGEDGSFFRKKNELILHYGVQEFERTKDGELVIEYLPDNDNYKSHEVKHYYPTQYGGEIRGVTVRAFLLLIGTHKYSSADMAHLIECTRNECLGCGIPIEEVETFEEKQLMEQLLKKAKEEGVKRT